MWGQSQRALEEPEGSSRKPAQAYAVIASPAQLGAL